jgi:hypothetical protein
LFLTPSLIFFPRGSVIAKYPFEWLPAQLTQKSPLIMIVYEKGKNHSSKSLSR